MESLTKIAKTLKVSRNQVEYRVKKYESMGLIKKYATIFNYKLLGYEEFIVVWIKLKSDKETKKKIRNEFKKNKNVLTYFDIIGKYCIGADFVYKNKEKFQEDFGEFLQRYKNVIKDYSVFMTNSAIFFPFKEFDNYQEKEFILENSEIKKEIDKKDLKILKELEKNGRAKIVDIATKANLSGELALYRLKQLYKNKVILGTRIIFDLKKLGYFFGDLVLKINVNEKIKIELFKYCKQHKYINALLFGIGESNCLVQVFYKDEITFRDSIKDILKKFNDYIQESDILLIENEGEVKTLPF
jgi:DNA-binding Lrp family transcriptional regulator